MLNNARLADIRIGKKMELIGWNFPESDWLKCNTGGACMEGGKITGYGGLIRDCSRRWIIGFTRYMGEGSVLTT